MKIYKFSLVILVLALFASCKKDNSTMATINLKVSDSGNLVSLAKGQSLSLTLANPGDGGFQFNDIEYSSSVLKLNSHHHIAATTGNAGDYGTDVWLFTPVNSGSTIIKVSAAQPWQGGELVSIFSGTVSVK